MLFRILPFVLLSGSFLVSGTCAPTDISILAEPNEAPKETLIGAETLEYFRITAAANKVANQSWGQPVEIWWQAAPLTRYRVVYATPKSELGFAGYRMVFVGTNYEAYLGFRG